MSASMHPRNGPMPQATFDSYDLAQSRVSCHKDDDIFDTIFPQPPPRSRIQAQRLARPSLPSLKAAAHAESADSSRSTAQPISSFNSVESVNSLSSYPSSTSSLSLLHSLHPSKQGSGDSSIDYYSPAVSDVNSAETDHSASSSHAHSHFSETEVHDARAPLTPLTPNGASHTWRPKELNLLRKRQSSAPSEPSIPAYHAAPSWNPSSNISTDRNPLLIGLGFGAVGFNPPPPPPPPPTAGPTSYGLSADKLMQSKQARAFLASRSPQHGAATAFSRDTAPSHNPQSSGSLGPKQLLLVSSGGPPTVRRFPGRRPSEVLYDNISPMPPPTSEPNSRSNTPQMRSPIPVMPSGPAFVDPRAPSPDPTTFLQEDHQARPSAHEFLAQIASTPEYQASRYLGSTASTATPSHLDSLLSVSDAADQVLEQELIQKHSPPTSSPDSTALAAKAPGFSSNQRSRELSLTKRKPPPTPLVLASSPATSHSDTLPGSAPGSRRRSVTATVNQRSPLSAPLSASSMPTSGKTPSSAASASANHLSDYSEPLRTAYYDFDSEGGVDGHDETFKTSDHSRDTQSPTAAQALAESAQDLLEAQTTRDSGSSEPAAAFEFQDLETESNAEGLSLQTMMGFLQRQESRKASAASDDVLTESESEDQDHFGASLFSSSEERPADQGQPLTASPESMTRDDKMRPAPPSSATPTIPSFNLSVFAPGQALVGPICSPLHSSVDPKRDVTGDTTVTTSTTPVLGSLRPGKQSVVPAPPTFAIREAPREDDKQRELPTSLASVPKGLEVRPILVRAPSDDLPAGSSRWSSGSESDGEAGTSIKGGGRKSFSKGRKSFSNSRKNSVALARELIAGPASHKEAATDNGGRQSKRSSETRLSAQGGPVQTPFAQTKQSAASKSKRMLLNGLPSLRKKSFSNLSSQFESPSTPTSAMSTGSFLDRTEFPFPPPVSPHVSTPSPMPGITSRPLDRNGIAGLKINTALHSLSAPGPRFSAQSPPTPLSATHGIMSTGSDGPLTTKQLLAQARSNVWPENYIGTGVSAAGLSSPFLSVDHDTFNHNFAPSRLAPAPPVSASAMRKGWSSTPHTPPVSQNPRFAAAAIDLDKVVPSTSVDTTSYERSRTRTAEVAPPPKNLRHLRKCSSNANLDKMREDVPSDLFKPAHTSTASIENANSRSQQGIPTPSPKTDVTSVGEEKLSIIGVASAEQEREVPEQSEPDLEEAAQSPVMVNRQRAKLQKARRIRKEQDRLPRYNSWSEFGLRWLAELGEEALDRLATETSPSSAILTASAASSGKPSQILAAGGAGGGDGDDGSDASDTDDYGSSDGGGGHGGAGGGRGGGDKKPGFNDADGSDEYDATSDEEQEAEAMTDDDSEDHHDEVVRSAAARASRSGPVPSVPKRNSSMAPKKAEKNDPESDSSDDRPLGLLVDNPKALQKALRVQERKRHFALARQALEGKGGSRPGSSMSSHTRQTGQVQGYGQKPEAVLNPTDLAQRLNKVHGRRERAQMPNSAVMQRSQTVARQDVAQRKQHADSAGLGRSKSVRTTPAEHHAHPGMRARTPSEAGLRAKAMAQATPQGSSTVSPPLGSTSKTPDLPSNAMATVVAAQKAMAQAQANPSPAALAQAQALAASATATLQAATAQVQRSTSPISPTFKHGDPVGHVNTSPRLPDGAELQSARQRAESRAHAQPTASSAGAVVAAPAVTPGQQPGMFQRLRSRSVSRQNDLTIKTSAAPMPDLPRPGTGSKDSQASSSPRSAQTASFAVHSSAAMQQARSVDTMPARGEGQFAQMQRVPSSHPSSMSPNQESASVPQHGPRQAHKVYILSQQRSTVVEIPVSARARDLALEVIERENLPMDDSKGGWVVFDCSSQLGIERPLREYEMIAEVVNMRAHPRSDFFLIKRTELSPYLSIRSVPASLPALAGYVYVQDRKKKWNKRWLELRDHGLYHAKNEKGKDETAICQISAFDVYLVDSSAIKMPKANGFALRSQDPITMFEKPDQDYVHYFCLTDPAAHRDWVRAILNARTYMLRQEKAMLFQTEPAAGAAEGVAPSGGLSRKSTSRRPAGRGADAPSSSAAGLSPPTPLIDSNAFAGPFAKGSLLADKAISDAKEALRGHAPATPTTAAFKDMSLMDRNALRQNEARRREVALDRQRRLKAEGHPLVDLARK